MSGMRRVDGNFVSKSKYGQKPKVEEEEINLEQGLEEETGKIHENKTDLNTNICNNIDNNTLDDKPTYDCNKFENLHIDGTIKTEEGKNEEEIKIDQNEVMNSMKELEEFASQSSRDDSQLSSVNEEKDQKCVLFKNFDNSASVEDIEEFFKSCGEVNKINIMVNKYTGLPKGYAVVEFLSEEGKKKALELNNTIFKGKQIRVNDKTRGIPNYVLSKNTYFKYHTCESRNKDGRALYNINSQGQSQVGPLKAKIVAHKSFHPY